MKYLIALSLLICFVLTFLSPGKSEEAQIIQRLEELQSLSELQEQQKHPFAFASTARIIGTYFTESTIFDFSNLDHPVVRIESRAKLTQRIVGVLSVLDTLEPALQNPTVSIQNTSASVTATASALGTQRGIDGQFLEIHTFEIHLIKENSIWLINKVIHLKNERD